MVPLPLQSNVLVFYYVDSILPVRCSLPFGVWVCVLARRKRSRRILTLKIVTFFLKNGSEVTDFTISPSWEYGKNHVFYDDRIRPLRGKTVISE